MELIRRKYIETKELPACFAVISKHSKGYGSKSMRETEGGWLSRLTNLRQLLQLSRSESPVYL